MEQRKLYISDLHLFHKNVTKAGKNFDDRPYENIEEMNEDILKVLEDDEQSAAVNKLFGASFCITGKLEHFSNRDALVEEIEKYGGKIVSGVTAKTNYLITNDKESGSSKNQKAIKFGTKIISEQEFIDLCK